MHNEPNQPRSRPYLVSAEMLSDEPAGAASFSTTTPIWSSEEQLASLHSQSEWYWYHYVPAAYREMRLDTWSRWFVRSSYATDFAAKARRFAGDWSSGPMMLMAGDTGLGKTRLAVATARLIIEQAERLIRVAFLSEADYLSALDAGGKERQEAKRKVAEYEVVIFDDIATANGFGQSAIFDAISTRYNNQRTTVVTTNADFDTLDRRAGVKLTRRIEERAGRDYLLDFGQG